MVLSRIGGSESLAQTVYLVAGRLRRAHGLGHQISDGGSVGEHSLNRLDFPVSELTVFWKHSEVSVRLRNQGRKVKRVAWA